MQVKRSTQETVYPEMPSPGGVVALSNSDQVIPRIYTPLLFFFSEMPAQETYSLLRRSLAETLSSFYPLAGRYREKASGELEILCNDEGAALHETWVDCGFDTFLPYVDPHPDFHLLVPQLDSFADVTKVPLLLAQITHFECGRICLGVKLHHNVCDASSTSDFLSCWAILSRAKVGRGLNGQGPQLEPYMDRSLLKANNPPSPIGEHPEYQTHTPAAPAIWDPCTSKIFSFTPSALEELRVRAGSCDQVSSQYTRFEAFAAHLWRGITYARGLAPDQEVRLGVAVDGRKRFNPPLPEGYFGNAVFCGCAVSKAGELIESSSPFGACLVKSAIAKVNDAYMRSALDWISMQTSVKSVYIALCTTSTDIAITSWWRLPFYELDFGWGNPSHVRTLFTFDGCIVLLPSPLGPGHVDALVGVNSHHMPKFEHYINYVQ